MHLVVVDMDGINVLISKKESCSLKLGFDRIFGDFNIFKPRILFKYAAWLVATGQYK